jgi:hypothetical protein
MKLYQSLLAFDTKVLDFLEPLCHKQQRFFGVTHYFWLKIEAFVTSVLIALYGYPHVSGFKKYVFAVAIIIFTGAAAFGYSWWEKKSYVRMQKGFINPLRVSKDNVEYRIIFYFMILLSTLIPLLSFFTGKILLVLFLLLVPIGTVFYSFMIILPACDPLPPSRGKLEEWFRSLGRRARQADI